MTDYNPNDYLPGGPKFGTVCEHDCLARVCLTCERLREIAALKAQPAEAVAPLVMASPHHINPLTIGAGYVAMTRPDYWPDCTIDCERRPECTVCGRTKKPIGRAAPMEMYCCDSDCEGYMKDPQPGHLWPGELAQMDAPPEES